MTGIGIAEIILLISCSLGLFVGIVGIFLLVLIKRRGRPTRRPPNPLIMERWMGQRMIITSEIY